MTSLPHPISLEHTTCFKKLLWHFLFITFMLLNIPNPFYLCTCVYILFGLAVLVRIAILLQKKAQIWLTFLLNLAFHILGLANSHYANSVNSILELSFQYLLSSLDIDVNFHHLGIHAPCTYIELTGQESKFTSLGQVE